MKLFVSYRRTELDAVRRVVKALGTAGIDCFLDLEDIDPLQNFPDRIREGIASSHALLAWWSRDYQESEVCLAEFLLAWQHARSDGKDPSRRVWVLNPEPRGDHIVAADLNTTNFLRPPASRGLKRWADGLRDRLSALVPDGSLGSGGVSVAEPVLRSVPRPRDAIVGRTLTMLRMHTRLFPPEIGLGTKSLGVEIHGFGGVGKTEVAATYARSFARAYPRGVFWLRMSDLRVEDAKAGLDAEAARVWLAAVDEARHSGGLPASDGNGRSLSASEVRARLADELAGDAPYLWVIDDVPEITPVSARDRVIESWRAPTPSGRTLLTTRDSRPIDGFVSEPLGVLDRPAALTLLSRYRAVSDAEHQAATELVWELGGHPLALVLIGEHLRGGVGYAPALKRLRNAGMVPRLEEVARILGPELGDSARSILATFELSISGLPAEARDLLGMISACAPNRPIARSMLLEISGGEAAADRFAVALRALLRASLVSARSGESWVEVHPLVSQVAAALLSADVARHRVALAQALLRDITAHLGSMDPELLHHLAHATTVARWLHSWLEVELLVRVAQHLRLIAEKVDLPLDDRFARWALVESNWMNDALHPLAIEALAEMAKAEMANGQLTSAIKRLREVLERQTITLSREHPDRLATMSELAKALLATGDDEGAKQMNARVTALRHLAEIRADPAAFKKSFDEFLAVLANYNKSPGVRGGVEIVKVVGNSKLLPLVTIPDSDLDAGLKDIKKVVWTVMAGLGQLPDPPESS